MDNDKASYVRLIRFLFTNDIRIVQTSGDTWKITMKGGSSTGSLDANRTYPSFDLAAEAVVGVATGLREVAA